MRALQRTLKVIFPSRQILLAVLSVVGLDWMVASPALGQVLQSSEVTDDSLSENTTFQGSAEGDATEPEVRLSDRAELERIIELYTSGQYAACSTQLSKFLDLKGADHFEDSRVLEEGRLYYASCTLLQGRRDEARKALRRALEENPLMPSPDSLTFPPPVVSLFLELRDEVQQLIAESEREQVVRLRRENELARRKAEQREYRERELEKLAKKESVVSKNSRYIAALPFGVGQFQNGNNVLGGVLLAAEGLLLTTAVSSGVILADLTSNAAGGGEVVGVPRYNRQRDAAYRTLTWSSWAFLGTAALGVLEAQLMFKPERRLNERSRPLPPELEVQPDSDPDDADSFKLEPTVGFGPGGGVIGVRGSF